MAQKRTLDSFFAPRSAKKPRLSADARIDADTAAAAGDVSAPSGPTTTTRSDSENTPPALPPSTHRTYPHPIPAFPTSITDTLLSGAVPAAQGKEVANAPHLDLVYYRPFIPRSIEGPLFRFLREELFWYRVEYGIVRGGAEIRVQTPRFSTVFGVDKTSVFDADGELRDAVTGKNIEKGRYKCQPRPIPGCLRTLLEKTEQVTSETYNICLVNYYASGSDSIAYHSDDEPFLGPSPTIASFSLGASRDFLMKHKPAPCPSASSTVTTASSSSPARKPTQQLPQPQKYPLGSGDMILMRGTTQHHWLHSIPKRANIPGGRINITLRNALVKAGTENYYRYNVGGGGVWRWRRGGMVECAGKTEGGDKK